MKDKPNFEPSKLIEKYKFIIGAVLLVLILVLGGYLLWRENYWKAGQKEKTANYETRINELEDKVVELEKAKSEAAADNQSTAQPVTNQPIESAGTIAGASTSESAAKTGSQPISGKININTASAAELDSLPGIGPVYAGRIIDYRNQNGSFKSIDEIKNIKGIGDKTFEKFKDQITI